MLYHSLLPLLLLVTAIQAHMRFVCPRPESANSGLKTGPCSKEGNRFEDSYVDITPGPLTLRFEETINHRGAPLRLTLNKYGDSDNICMLLDHYPHNENGTMNIGSKCNPFDWDLGGCNTQHYVTVNIPDITCDRCFLQLVSVMTDKYTDAELPCHQIDQANNNCSSYFSCANVKIRPTEAGKSKNISTCLDYKSNLVGDWPYRPRNFFKCQLSGSQPMTAEANFDVLGGNLLITLASAISQMAVEFLKGESVLCSIDVNGKTAQWEVPEQHRVLFQTSGVIMRLMDKVKGTEVARGEMQLTEKRYERDYYRRNGVHMTPAGWLREPEFVGPSATYPFAMEPHGPCVLDTKYYGASTTADVGHGAVVTVTLTDLHAWVRAASTGRPFLSASLTDSTQALPAMELPRNLFTQDDYIFSGILDMTEIVRSGGFYNQVKITLGPEATKVEATVPLAEAMVAPILSGGARVGEAVVTPGPDMKLTYTAVVSFPAGSTQRVVGMSLNGPARRTKVGEKLLPMPVSSSPGGAFSTGAAQKVCVVVLDALHAGQLYVDVQLQGASTAQRMVSGQLPPREACRSNDNSCFSTLLTFGGGELNRYKKTVETNGYATFRMQSGNIEYKITLRDFKTGDQVTKVLAGDYTITPNTFTPSTLEDNVQILQGTISDAPSELKADLEAGDLEVQIYTDIYVLQSISGKLPPIKEVTC